MSGEVMRTLTYWLAHPRPKGPHGSRGALLRPISVSVSAGRSWDTSAGTDDRKTMTQQTSRADLFIVGLLCGNQSGIIQREFPANGKGIVKLFEVFGRWRLTNNFWSCVDR